MYIFDGNAIVVNIRAEAREKKVKYPMILTRAIIFTLSLFIVFSTICYYVYREDSQPIFTMSLQPMNSLIMFSLCCVCINAMTSYPVQMLAAFNILEKFEVL
jgi:amino acid permease